MTESITSSTASAIPTLLERAASPAGALAALKERYAAVRAEARMTRAADKFLPDHVELVIQEAGGLQRACWYVDRTGAARRAVRVMEDTPMLSRGRVKLLLKRGLLVWDENSQRPLAMQELAFNEEYRRSFSSAAPITDMKKSLQEQALELMNKNARLQDELQGIIATSVGKGFFKRGKIKDQQQVLDLWAAEVAQHLQDLKDLQSLATSH